LLYNTSYTSFKNKIELSPEDEHHLGRVMRIKTGEQILLTDNEGNLAKAKISQIAPLELEILSTQKGEPAFPLCVFLPLFDKDRLEWTVEKLCELNIKSIQLYITERCQYKELSENKFNRLFKIAEAAQKQSERTSPFIIQTPIQLSKVKFDPKELYFVGATYETQFKIFDFELETLNFELKNLFIGPEGGFTNTEMNFFEKQKVQKINTGQTILRTETAAIVLATLLKLQNNH
jgi:16S rRNA (uracil1498-N3)-methyltransferase